MVRTYRRSGRYTRRLKTVKYSSETFNLADDWQFTSGVAQMQVPVVSAINQQGVRKCKNFEFSCSSTPFIYDDDSGNTFNTPLFWALVYVPQGTQPNQISLGSGGTTASLYEPNQNVIMSGIIPADNQAIYRVRTRLARNLNSGDAIYVIFRAAANPSAAATKSLAFALNYAISF